MGVIEDQIAIVEAAQTALDDAIEILNQLRIDAVDKPAVDDFIFQFLLIKAEYDATNITATEAKEQIRDLYAPLI